MRLPPALSLPFVLVAASSSTSAAQTAARPMVPAASDHLERGARLYDSGDFAGAIVEFERGHDLDPHPDFLYAIAQAHRRNGNCESAVRFYESFLATNPPPREAERARANIVRCGGQPETSAAGVAVPDSDKDRTVDPFNAAPSIPDRDRAIDPFGRPQLRGPRFISNEAPSASLSTTSGGKRSQRSYPVSETLRPLRMPRGMVEVRTSMEVDMPMGPAAPNGLLLRTAGRVGVHDRLELQAGLDVFLYRDHHFKERYLDTGQPWAIPYDDARLSVAVELPLHRAAMDLRVGADVPMNAGDAVGYPSPDRPDMDPPEGLELDFVLGMPCRWALTERFALFAFDRILTFHTTRSRPDVAAPIGIIITPTEVASFIIGGQLVVPRADEPALNALSAAVQLTTRRRLDFGAKWTLARTLERELRGTQTGESWVANSRYFVQLYAQFRF